jgi:hypothetical protein
MYIRLLYRVDTAWEVHPPWNWGYSWLIPLGSSQLPRDP